MDYSNPSAVKLSKMFSRTWEVAVGSMSSLSTTNVAVNEGTISVLVRSRDITRDINDETVSLLFTRLTDHVVHCVLLADFAFGGSYPASIAVGEDLVITTQHWGGSTFEILHLGAPGTILPSALHPVHLGTKELTFSATQGANCHPDSLSSCEARHPKYGVLNVTNRTWRSEEEVLHTLHFLPAEHDGSNLIVGSHCFYQHPCEIDHMVVGSSGTCAVILDETTALGLAQYVPLPTPHVEFRPLGIPDFEPELHMPSSVKMGLDDRLGVLYMTDRDVDGGCRLTVIAYA